MDRISRLLKITERECNHKLVLYVKNLHELGASSFPYIVHVLPCPLLAEFVKGKHFVLTDLLKLISRISSQANSSPEPLVQPDIDECPVTLITNPGFSKIWDRFHIYMTVFLITFLVFSFIWFL